VSNKKNALDIEKLLPLLPELKLVPTAEED
jgi:hypothetical protein